MLYVSLGFYIYIKRPYWLRIKTKTTIFRAQLRNVMKVMQQKEQECPHLEVNGES